jgi:protein-tyrosine phosphatase
MGFVDLHCHILWDLDDGCRSPLETLRAARSLVALGYSDVSATPHARTLYAGGDARLSRARLLEARALLAGGGVELALHAGAENAVGEELLGDIASGMVRGLGEAGRYVLVEVPFQGEATGFPAIVSGLLASGLVPVVAHPERCVEFERRGRAAEVARMGAALQLNLGALTGRHGRRARELAERFLDDGLYAMASTDLHSPEGAQEWIGEALETLTERAGGAGLRRLCEENPRRALAGSDLS